MNSFIIFAPERERGKSKDREKIGRDTDKNIYRKRGRGKKRERERENHRKNVKRKISKFKYSRFSSTVENPRKFGERNWQSMS